ncbi:hypothetical protein [Hymenobacter nivis]|nr:hypothetical protein [Hymenobacter nivis]
MKRMPISFGGCGEQDALQEYAGLNAAPMSKISQKGDKPQLQPN